MLAHVNAVVGAPHPDTGGVDAHVWVPAKSWIQFGGVGQRLLIQLFDVPRPCVRGRERISNAATCSGSESSSAVIIAASNGSSGSIGQTEPLHLIEIVIVAPCCPHPQMASGPVEQDLSLYAARQA